MFTISEVFIWLFFSPTVLRETWRFSEEENLWNYPSLDRYIILSIQIYQIYALILTMVVSKL